ncbi:MAG: hypothetical protein GY816_10160 [Cytophagales bacterium]|nr:hypothetical protein [Cytophagales bacterium]
MKKLKIITIMCMGAMLASCVDDGSIVDDIGGTPNVVDFETTSINFGGLADGSEYAREFYVKLTGPSLDDVTGDVTVNIAVDASSSTAVSGTHFTLNTASLTLSTDNDYFGVISITMLSEGNSPPQEGTPEFDDYEAPYIDLVISSVSSSEDVVGTGKVGRITLNFTPPNPYAGDYSAYIEYRHPSAGTYPDNINVAETNVKTMTALTGTKVEMSWFAVWEGYSTELTVNADNSIAFTVSPDWGQTVLLGDPFDATKISYYDPATRIIYLYYYYDHDSGTGVRNFWEIYTPLF